MNKGHSKDIRTLPHLDLVTMKDKDGLFFVGVLGKLQSLFEECIYAKSRSMVSKVLRI